MKLVEMYRESGATNWGFKAAKQSVTARIEINKSFIVIIDE